MRKRVWQRGPPLPFCELFQIHARKSERDLHRNLCKTTQLRKAQAMLYLCIGKNTLDLLFAFVI